MREPAIALVIPAIESNWSLYPHFLLPTSYFLLPTSYFLLPTSYSLLLTSYSIQSLALVTALDHIAKFPCA